ncbi:hypothetical protein AHF37_04024 [Paragonimus kellicotti]|nr:hypothetical protein AHF37_04024 [Paragonimus kellicotti]
MIAAVIDAVSAAQGCGSANRDVMSLPVASVTAHHTMPMSLSTTHEVIFEDDYDENTQLMRSSPASVRTSAKESSPGSSELPSMPSEKSTSRGCSGDGSTGFFPVYEVTDIERSTSEGSLSPIVQPPDVSTPVLNRQSESVIRVSKITAPSEPKNLASHTMFSNSVTSNGSILRLSQSAIDNLAYSVPTTYRTTAFNQVYCSTPIHAAPNGFDANCTQDYHLYRDENSWRTSHGANMDDLIPRRRKTHTNPLISTVCPKRAVASATEFTNSNGSCLYPSVSPSSLRSTSYESSNQDETTHRHEVRTRPDNNFSTQAFSRYPVYSAWVPPTLPADTIPTFPGNFLHLDGGSAYVQRKNSIQSMSQCDNSLLCDRFNHFSQSPTLLTYGIPHSSCSVNSHRTTNSLIHSPLQDRLSSSDGACYPKDYLTHRKSQRIVEFTHPSSCTVSVAPDFHLDSRSSKCKAVFRKENEARLPMNNYYPYHTTVSLEHLQQHAFNSVSITNCGCTVRPEQSKRRPPSSANHRAIKRRRITDKKNAQHPVDSPLESAMLSSNRHLVFVHTLHELHDPVVSLPITLCPPSPVPSLSKSNAKWLTIEGDPSSANLQSGNLPLGKYRKFPMFLSTPSTSSVKEMNLCDFLGERRDLHKLLRNNLLISSHHQASIRSCQPSSYYSPPTPPSVVSPVNLLDHSSLVEKNDLGRTTPPLPTVHCRWNSVREISKHSLASKFERESLNFTPQETVLSSESLYRGYPSVCLHCSMQILERFDAIHWKHSEGNGHAVFCSFQCLLAHLNSGLFFENGLFSGCTIGVCSVLSDLMNPPTVILLQQPDMKCVRSGGRRPVTHDKFARRRSCLESVCTSRSFLGRRPWRWNQNRWQKFSKQFALYHRSFSTVSDHTDYPNHYSHVSSEIREHLMPVQEMFSRLNTSCHSSSFEDTRVCQLCQKSGDAANGIAGRLLQYDYNVWLHLNCILWCYDTYETVSGSLIDVSCALKKAQRTFCTYCNAVGAGLPCFQPDCEAIYHLPCAHVIGCSFYADRGMYCPTHRDDGDKFSRLSTLAVERKVFISRDESSQVADVIRCTNQHESHCKCRAGGVSAKLRVGGLILHNVGQLLPEHLASGLFHSNEFIYPVGYSSTRIYWSYRHVRQRCSYHCKIEEVPYVSNQTADSKTPSASCAKFVVICEEDGEPAELFEHSTCDGVWQQILSRINQMRREAGGRFLRIIQGHLHGEVLYGLTEPHVVRAIESLPGVDRLSNYVFKFGRLQLIKEMPLAVNPTGCVRSEPKLRTHIRRRSTAEVLSSQQHMHLIPVDTGGSDQWCSPVRSNLGSPVYLSSTFGTNVSKYQQYRRLRIEWRINVFLARSRIQGLGLYAARDFVKQTFIIEYLGELIRNEVGNRRELLYESQNRGVYMFRVDDDSIVDATMCGGLARYINHSCEPNCAAEVIHCDGGGHIIIVAKRDIEKGEELTYDYQFDIEEDRVDRIPCLCGAPNCRKWMN